MTSTPGWTFLAGLESAAPLRVMHAGAARPSAAGLALGAITLADRGDGALVLEVPGSSTERLFYRARSDGTTLLSSDLRRLRTDRCEIDPVGLFGVLQFGAAIPPRTIWKDIRRVVPGARSLLQAGAGEATILGSLIDAADESRPAAPPIDAERAVERVVRTLDEGLSARLGGGPAALLFSGGVDSGLIAARLRAIGRSDVDLINYSFGQDDAESRLAEEMARHLGLPFRRVPDATRDALDCLAAPFRQWPYPFADHSTAPTHQLAHAVVESLETPRTILDGTGADGLFGMFAKSDDWTRIRRVPGPLREAVSRLYRAAELWRSAGRLEYGARVVRRSAYLPGLAAMLAQNPLHGIAYEFAQGDIDSCVLDIQRWAEIVLRHGGPALQFPALDVALICCDIFVGKAQSVLEDAGFEPHYPFLDPRMAELALTEAYAWPRASEPKAVLKQALMQSVPATMVERPKSGFHAPQTELFSREALLRHVVGLLDSASPLAPWIGSAFVRRVRDDLAARRALPVQTYNAIWALVFADAWLRGAAAGD